LVNTQFAALDHASRRQLAAAEKDNRDDVGR